MIAVAGLLVGHVVLALVMRNSQLIVTAHAVATGVGAMAYAATTRRIRYLSIVVAYIAGSEVLWRMNGARVFHEFGKYAIVAVLLIALARISARRNRRLALVYLGLLLPSAALTFSALSPDMARQEVAFNLSGPVAMAAAVIFFSNVRMTPNHLRATFVALIAPVAGIWAISVMSTRTAQDLEFTGGANVATSGGFGPNQVAAMLGLAVMFLLLISLDRRLALRVRIGSLVLAAAFAAQTVLTFSRGGIGLALLATAGAMFMLMRGNARARRNVIVVGALASLIGVYVIEPRLEEFTKGKLGERYSSAKSSGRDVYADSELQMFLEHPLLGVGPGVGRQLRSERFLRSGPSHTEYTRMLGEHGILGFIALCCLVVLGVRAVKDAGEQTPRAIATAMVIWVGVFLAIYGTRIAAPAFVIGIAFAMRPPPPKPDRASPSLRPVRAR